MGELHNRVLTCANRRGEEGKDKIVSLIASGKSGFPPSNLSAIEWPNSEVKTTRIRSFVLDENELCGWPNS